MTIKKMNKLACYFLLSISTVYYQAETLENIHFLIPAGPGGGWDGTARGVGEALIKSGISKKVSYENLSGGGGSRAIAKLIETANRQQNTLLVSSSPMVIKSLQKIFPQNFRDLKPIASVIADYTCFAVSKNSPYQNWNQVIKAFLQNPKKVTVAGGSFRGSTDHLIFAKAVELAGGNPRSVTYIPYDGGRKALAGILTGEMQILSTGLSEAIKMSRAGKVRILAVTSPQRLNEAKDIPTLVELGYSLTFANWHGFFAAKGLTKTQYQKMSSTLRQLVSSPEFEAVRQRHGWSLLHKEEAEFFDLLVQQEVEMSVLMKQLGLLKN